MRSWVFGFACTLGIALAACSSDDATNAGPGAGGGNGGRGDGSVGGQSNLGGSGSQPGTEGTSNQNVAGSANVSAGCPVWPKQKVFPTVGPFFYGPNPGPCKMTVLSTSTATAETTFTYSYDASGQLISQTTADGSTVIMFQFEQALLTSETSTTNSVATVTTYTYSGNTVTYSSTNSSGVTAGYSYTLDAQGYPIATAVLNPPSAVSESYPTHYSYEYENCRLLRRLGYNAANAEIASTAAQYTYDSLGRVSHRTTSGRDEVYDYSCW